MKEGGSTFAGEDGRNAMTRLNSSHFTAFRTLCICYSMTQYPPNGHTARSDIPSE